MVQIFIVPNPLNKIREYPMSPKEISIADLDSLKSISLEDLKVIQFQVKLEVLKIMSVILHLLALLR